MKITMLWIGAVAALMPAAAAGEPFLHFPGVRIRPITCNFTCYRYNRGRGDLHGAIDYGFADSNEIRAAAGGEVTAVVRNIPRNVRGDGFGYGNHVFVRHENGYVTLYAHLLLETIAVQMDSRVEAGQRIGLSDNSGASTGPHLHFEVRDPQGRRVNPYGDPPDYIGGCGPNALWATCPPTPAPPPDVDADGDEFTIAGGDCDDRNPNVYPGADEFCNGVDDDCSGTSDDPWRSGLAQDIGNPCTVGTGACANTGTWTCTPDGRATVCNVDPLPSQPEACNGLDDDCDGEIDEDWRAGLSTDLDRSCTVGIGACARSATWVCAPDGLATVCDALPGDPAPESCNGLDDDCDDFTDEDWRSGLAQDIGRQCFTEAVCGTVEGRWECTPDGRATVCVPREICNGVDDDCNGVVDDVESSLLANDPEHCGRCFRRCGSLFPEPNQCWSGYCYSGCAAPGSICYEYCRILHCPNCSGVACGDGIFSCFERCESDVGAAIGDNPSVQSCACRGCRDCCCVSAGGFTECRNPCR